jgi:hypothetical protein
MDYDELCKRGPQTGKSPCDFDSDTARQICDSIGGRYDNKTPNCYISNSDRRRSIPKEVASKSTWDRIKEQPIKYLALGAVCACGVATIHFHGGSLIKPACLPLTSELVAPKTGRELIFDEAEDFIPDYNFL